MKRLMYIFVLLFSVILPGTTPATAAITTISPDFVNRPDASWDIGGNLSFDNGVAVIRGGGVVYNNGGIGSHINYTNFNNMSDVLEVSADLMLYSSSRHGNTLEWSNCRTMINYKIPGLLDNDWIGASIVMNSSPTPSLEIHVYGRINGQDDTVILLEQLNEVITLDQFYNLKTRFFDQYIVFFVNGKQVYHYQYGYDLHEIERICCPGVGFSNHHDPIEGHDAEGEVKNLIIKYGKSTAVAPIGIVEEVVFLTAGNSETIDITGGTGFFIAASSDETIASASFIGSQLEITGVSRGSAQILVTDSEDNTGTVDIVVVEINPSSLVLAPQETQTISIDGGAGFYRAVSGDLTVAKVTVNGSRISVTGIDLGATTITITDSNSKVYTVPVTVRDTGTGGTETLTTVPISVNVSKGNTANIKIVGGSGFYKVASDDKSVATIVTGENNEAHVRGEAEGSTTVTITDSDGKIVAIPVNVTQIVKAIIVAGSGSYPTNYLWDSTVVCTQYAYRVLQYQGFANDTIAYYATGAFVDVDGDGINDVDDDATNRSIETAITGWATDAKEVLIYMVGHGSDGKFQTGEFEYLDAGVLNGWIKTLENRIPGQVTLIYDACQSGSFVSHLVPDAGKKRVVITSTSRGESAYFTSAGAISFSSFFWTQIHNGANIRDAFTTAKSSIEYTYTHQTPLLDDNGNGIGNDVQDGVFAKTRFFGNGIVSAGDVPTFSHISPSMILNQETSATIFAENVMDLDGIFEVWAVVTPPDFIVNSPESPVLNLPVVKMDHVGNNRYEGIYTDFHEKGNYNIAVFAKDMKGHVSTPMSTSFIKSSGQNHALLNSALTITIPCIGFQGNCYRMVLNYAAPVSGGGDPVWKLDMNSLGIGQNCGSDCALLDASLQITIPKITFQENLYQLSLKQFVHPDDPSGLYWKLDLYSYWARPLPTDTPSP